MTLAEFKAWFEGYTDGIGGMPNEAQWEHIKTMVETPGLVASRLRHLLAKVKLREET